MTICIVSKTAVTIYMFTIKKLSKKPVINYILNITCI